MKPLFRLPVAVLVLAAAGAASSSASAADVTRQDILSLFELQQMDRNHDQMISKKEFMEMLSKAWDMEASKMLVTGAMTREQYKAFSAMFNLDIGG